ncbi:unnamed protein product [Zymoseptoria tritici ST99CH_1A5]|uniref:Uncharacterized protein n=3 Tax=Zymoseptoria tritici TaxID=1047171 RepID=A0A1X7RXS4_ZYMT9|nr:unnamed protein product [Zymoseptoria tritici ST99CH_3D7]SMR54596.1 unnamed protein product [Zymoseptoria tritici ST99CH_1E4]SMY25638.1 unnamed protein product [Zymoseptoria tritici ST99CH_1A5]
MKIFASTILLAALPVGNVAGAPLVINNAIQARHPSDKLARSAHIDAQIHDDKVKVRDAAPNPGCYGYDTSTCGRKTKKAREVSAMEEREEMIDVGSA